MNISIFDETYEKLISEAIGLTEMPIAGISDLDAFSPSSEHGTYSITDVTGDDSEKISEVILKTAEYVLDYLKEPSPKSRKEFQDVVAEFIRKAINDIFPDSKKASGGKPFTARDYYAARAVIKALETQGVIDTKAKEIEAGDVEKEELPAVADKIANDSEVENKVQDDLDDTKSDVEDREEDDVDSTEDEEDDIEDTEEVELAKGETFNIYDTYDIVDQEGENLSEVEAYVLDRIEPESTGKEIKNNIESSLRMRDKPGLVKKVLDSLVSKGLLKRVSRELGDAGEGESEEDFIDRFTGGYGKSDIETGEIERY